MSAGEWSARVVPKKKKRKTTTTISLTHREGHGAPGTLPPGHSRRSTHRTLPKAGRESFRITKLKAPLHKATLRDVHDEPSTAAALATPSDKNMVLRMSRSFFCVSSPLLERELISPLTGIAIRWDGATKRAMGRASCVARPVFEMDLRTVELLGVSLREELSLKHNINGGFIVKHIANDSALERLGVRRGNVIFFEDECGSTLPEIKYYLLSLGWRYLRGMRSMVLELEVQDIAGPSKETITLPLEFSVDSGEVARRRMDIKTEVT